jgi:hypothetical protein
MLELISQGNFEADKICRDPNPEGTYASSMDAFPRSDGTCGLSVSKLEHGQFFYIKNVNTKSGERVQGVAEKK